MAGRQTRKRQVLDRRSFEDLQRLDHLIAAHQPVDTDLNGGSCALQAGFG